MTRTAWAQQAMPAWRPATHSARARAAVAVLADDALAALCECFSSGRPFSFCRDCDTVERVRLRNAWEWRKWVASQYAATAAQLTR